LPCFVLFQQVMSGISAALEWCKEMCSAGRVGRFTDR